MTLNLEKPHQVNDKDMKVHKRYSVFIQDSLEPNIYNMEVYDYKDSHIVLHPINREKQPFDSFKIEYDSHKCSLYSNKLTQKVKEYDLIGMIPWTETAELQFIYFNSKNHHDYFDSYFSNNKDLSTIIVNYLGTTVRWDIYGDTEFDIKYNGEIVCNFVAQHNCSGFTNITTQDDQLLVKPINIKYSWFKNYFNTNKVKSLFVSIPDDKNQFDYIVSPEENPHKTNTKIV